MTVELQACRNDLHNTRLLASESTRLAEATTAAMHQLAIAKGAMSAAEGAPHTAGTGAASTVYTVTFENNSTQLNLAEAASLPLLAEARQASLIVIRGRTDATSDAAMNAKAARERAEAARDLLATAGIDPKRMRLSWQAWGDHVADNATAEGKSQNRRVEIELYRAVPTRAAALQSAPAISAPAQTDAAEVKAAAAGTAAAGR